MLFLDLLVYYLQLVVGVLLSVAFLTLLERKTLRYTQLRKGPNKLGFVGVLQPFSDAVKLFSKEDISPVFVNIIIFRGFPFFSFVMSLFVWVSFVSLRGWVDISFSYLFCLCCARVITYGTVISGWSSSSKYSLLGSLRAVAQTISYEIVWAFIFLFLIFIRQRATFYIIFLINQIFSVGVLCGVIFVLFFVVCVVETNRAPFDLAEGESELVSGFNVEYGGLKFALIFLAEYASILWISCMCVICFGLTYYFVMVIMFLFFIFIFLYMRSSFPRVRYDFLMMLTWKKFLPLILLWCIFIPVLV